jgi:hypothetical protein
MGSIKKNWSINDLHVISWLFKDAFWCLKFTWLATFMVFPTAFLTLFILYKERNHTNLILSFWVFMNIFWMLYEIQNFPEWPIKVFMFLGIFSIFAYVLKKRADESDIPRH